MGISLGLVGLGTFGSKFAYLFKNHPLVDRVGLCDREDERIRKFADDPSFADKFNPSDAYSSFEEICKSDLDALVIITQPWLHAPQAVQGLLSGKSVYSAVPIISIPDGDEILDWCDKLVNTCVQTGKHYMLGETTYYRAPTMYCRRKAAEGAFGDFVMAEGRYFHDVDQQLRDVARWRTESKSGKEWLALRQAYSDRGVFGGPMHYPTHSTSGPICVMGAHAVKVSAWGMPADPNDDYFTHEPMANQTALFRMSNGASMSICEYRKIGGACFEGFNLFGTKGRFHAGPHEWDCSWATTEDVTKLEDYEEMRDPLPPEVFEVWEADSKTEGVYGGHGGSHSYLVNEFVQAVAADRTPAINAWEATRYMAPGVMAHKSAMKDGEVLDVPDWGDAPA